MRHEIRIQGYAFRLRPAEISDSAFVLSLRTDPELSRYISPTSDRLADQEAWMQRYFGRPNDYYWMIVRTATGQAEGAVAIYDVDEAVQQAEWGRWVVRKGSLAAIESTLLVYRAGFNMLGLQRMYCHTVSVNRRVVSYHTSCGLETSANGQLKRNLRGREYDHVEQYLTLDRWPAVERSLDERAAAVAGLLSRRTPAR